MNNLSNNMKVIRRKKPRICLALIGPPQFSITLEHRNDPNLGWTSALCILWLAIFIDWNWQDGIPISWRRDG